MPEHPIWTGSAAPCRTCSAIVTELKRRGIAFRGLAEQMDITKLHGEVLFGVFGALAQYERALTQERMLAGQARRSAAGARAAVRPQ